MVSYIVDIKRNGHWEPDCEYYGLMTALQVARYVSDELQYPVRVWRYELSGLTLVSIFNPPVSLE